MTLVLDADGRLPPKRHRATEAEIKELFVDGAPYSAERALIWDAFLVYRSIAIDLMPSVKFWMDGGFVTHKEWAAPSDLDVAMIVPQEEFVAAAAHVAPLLTSSADGVRSQPMGGKIDGHVGLSGVTDSVGYWADLWSRVLDKDRNELPGQRKGYVEVMYP